MNILFDFITPQHFVGGAGEYTRRVFFSLLERIKENPHGVKIFGVYDSRLHYSSYPELSPKNLRQLGVNSIDVKGKSLKEIVSSNSIDKIFIGAGQYWTEYDLTDVSCPMVCVVHDLCDEEYYENRLIDLEKSIDIIPYILYRLRRKIKKPRRLLSNRTLVDAVSHHAKSRLITVSEYSRLCIRYHFNLESDKIIVLYSPERISQKKDRIENDVLRSVVETGKRYFLLLSADRKKKNAMSALRAFCRYIENSGEDAWIVTVGAKTAQFNRQIVLPYLSESDLSHAMENCYALIFPSIFEGFGYPPVEAMKHGKPILHSNVTSIPEIVGDGQISFSPFYSSDIYSAFTVLTDINYKIYSDNAIIRYQELLTRQKKDLQHLLDLILE